MEDRRRSGRYADFADQEGRRHRRRHDGRRHLDEFPQRRHPGDDRRNRAGRARPRRRHHPPQLRQYRQERPTDASRRANPHGTAQPRLEPRRFIRLRSRDRGDLREHGHQERGVPQARQDRQARRDPRLQHLLSQHRRDRLGHEPAGSCHRHALLLAGERDAAPGSGAWRKDGQAGNRHRHAACQEDRQDRRTRGRVSWLRRQSHAAPAPARGAKTHPRGRHALGRRPRPL